MAKHLASRLRWPTALTALLAWGALAPTPTVDAQSSAPQNASETATAAPPAANARLEAVEQQLRNLLDAEEQRNERDASRPTLQIGGLLNIDYLWIDQDDANRASVGDAENVFDFRRARLTGRGEAYDVVEYAIGFDFALDGRPSFLDNFIAVRELPLLGTLLAGHFFEPFSLERYTFIRFTTFMERSLADTFAPARNLGIMARNTLGEHQRGTWAVGWFRSNSNSFGEDFNSTSASAVTTRITWLPMYDEANEGRSLLHLGAAYTYRSEEQDQIQFQSFPEARAGTPQPAGIPPFVDTGIIAAGSDQRVGTEVLLIRGPLTLQGEYIFTSVDQIAAPRLTFHGAYGFISYFLTGEHRTYNKSLGTLDRVFPFENFFRVRTEEGIEQGRGAWEVAVRYSHIDLDSENIAGGTLDDVTLALNWHLNPFTRIRWEYIHAQLNRAPIGESLAHIGGMRFEIDF